MDLKLEGRRALVTGSTRGIGTEIARVLAQEGARVLVHGRSQEQAEGVAEQIGAAGGVAGDLSTTAGADSVFDGVQAVLGGLDVLVNNAGHFETCSWTDATARRWADTYNTEVLSVVRLVRRFVPEMRKTGWGRIIQIASISASIGPPLFPDYAAAKAGMVNLTLSLMQELTGTGITVNTVSPGPVPTGTWLEFARQIGRIHGWDEDIEKIKQNLLDGWLANPGQRFGREEDIADAVAFLASGRASHINGVNLAVTGGLAARVS